MTQNMMFKDKLDLNKLNNGEIYLYSIFGKEVIFEVSSKKKGKSYIYIGSMRISINKKNWKNYYII